MKLLALGDQARLQQLLEAEAGTMTHLQVMRLIDEAQDEKAVKDKERLAKKKKKKDAKAKKKKEEAKKKEDNAGGRGRGGRSRGKAAGTK